MTPEEYAEANDVEYRGEQSEAGVFFAEFHDGISQFFMRVFDGVVHEPTFTEVGADGNYTYGIVEGESMRRMVDDDGVHEPLRNY